MKKIILLLLFVVSAFSFGANFKPYLKGNASNPEAKKILFTAQMESTKKVVTLYKDREKIVYVFGLEGKKPEITLKGFIGDDVVFNATNSETYEGKFLVFLNGEYRYIVSFYNVNGKTVSYLLEAYKGMNPRPLYKKQLNNKTVYDKIFNTPNNAEGFDGLFYDQNYLDSENFYMNY